MKIITIDREFGSGGRELGKRLSDALNIPCYDEQILEMIAQKHGMDKNYVEHMSEKSIRAAYPLTIARRFSVPYRMMEQSVEIAVSQRKLIEELAAQGDCIIIGRCADIILKNYRPLNLFIYADHGSKLERCIKRASADEHLSASEIERRMKKIDRGRAEMREAFTNTKWGAKENYHLCVNTSGIEIKTLIPVLTEYIRQWFTSQQE